MSDGANWSVNAACQNMAAILNDPKRGKQKDFFTRTWGESFVETSAIPPSPLLPNVDDSYFAPYLKKISKRYKKTNRKSASNLVGENAHQQHIPSRLAGRHFGKDFYLLYLISLNLHINFLFLNAEPNEVDLNIIPKPFLQSSFKLSQSETFYNVFPFIKDSGISHVLTSGKTLQEKLSHYLDLIEMQIAHQISHKSEDFFQAVASHDIVREELGKALTAVKALRLKVKLVDGTVVQGSLKG